MARKKQMDANGPTGLVAAVWTYHRSFSFSITLVFLQHAQIFRLLLKISVEENNWMSLQTNFSSPCPMAGLPKRLVECFYSFQRKLIDWKNIALSQYQTQIYFVLLSSLI